MVTEIVVTDWKALVPFLVLMLVIGIFVAIAIVWSKYVESEIDLSKLDDDRED
jgi:hypothetical protein